MSCALLSKKAAAAPVAATAKAAPAGLHVGAPFHTPEDLDALARQAALAEAALSEFLTRGSRLYTSEQLDALLAEFGARYRQPDSQVA
jgi:hypothetical protein